MIKKSKALCQCLKSVSPHNDTYCLSGTLLLQNCIWTQRIASITAQKSLQCRQRPINNSCICSFHLRRMGQRQNKMLKIWKFCGRICFGHWAKLSNNMNGVRPSDTRLDTFSDWIFFWTDPSRSLKCPLSTLCLRYNWQYLTLGHNSWLLYLSLLN